MLIYLLSEQVCVQLRETPAAKVNLLLFDSTIAKYTIPRMKTEKNMVH